MPTGGKGNKPRPRFSFVNLEFEAGEVSWVKRHAGPTRSHAAYWGGPVGAQRHQHNADTPALNAVRYHAPPQEAGPVYGCFPTRSSRRWQAIATKTIEYPPLMLSTPTPRQFEPDPLLYLPSLPFEISGTITSAAVCSSLFEFFGETFVKRFLTSYHEDASIMFCGCLLLSYAHNMALTGVGMKTVLLQLKGQLIRQLNTKIATSNILSPRCLTAILALGAPIVCLASQDLPNSLSIRDYVDASAKGDCLCCREPSDMAPRALAELIVHRQAMERLLLQQKTATQDSNSLALLQYISSHLKVSTALEPAHLNPLLLDDRALFPETCPHESTIPSIWSSPLASRWYAKTPTTHAEAAMLALEEVVHGWFSTFLDDEDHPSFATQEVSEQRETLREEIVRIVSITKTPETGEEGMYECCRWASLMLLAVEEEGVPIPVAATHHVQIQPRLVRCLRMTDLSDLWGVHKGLLFWVAALCHAASAGQCFPLLCTTLLARFAQAISMSGYCSEMAIKPLRRLKAFEALCCRHRVEDLSATISPDPTIL
ncbi:hypothetical protein EDD37DRAFT_410916 [Exophiala viscosa]|uniref:Transcription factor domain-containing protein n=1 Tax=Exophiala viscosa TaxID=2486360 RepID=A0AAN6IE80_9EURO|nr:hypothetical protein EDD36DRAFT_493717 [Exophiala viscosa]KAI1624398.1 hypothetical protein EDD37DRAFT_410916 [Exophiala viscosa]